MGQFGSGQIQRQIYTSQQSQKPKVVLDLKFFYISSEQMWLLTCNPLEEADHFWPWKHRWDWQKPNSSSGLSIDKLMYLWKMRGLGTWHVCHLLRNLQSKWQILTERLSLLSCRTLDTKIVSETEWCSCYQKLRGEKIEASLPITCQHPVGMWQIYFIKSKASVSV